MSLPRPWTPHRPRGRRRALRMHGGRGCSPGCILQGPPGGSGGHGGDGRIREDALRPAVDPRRAGRDRQPAVGAPLRRRHGLVREDGSHRRRGDRLVRRGQAHRPARTDERSPPTPGSPCDAPAPAHRAAYRPYQPAPPGDGGRGPPHLRRVPGPPQTPDAQLLDQDRANQERRATKTEAPKATEAPLPPIPPEVQAKLEAAQGRG